MGSSKGTTRYAGSCRTWVGWERGLTASHKLGNTQESERQGKACTAEEGEASGAREGVCWMPRGFVEHAQALAIRSAPGLESTDSTMEAGGGSGQHGGPPV